MLVLKLIPLASLLLSLFNTDPADTAKSIAKKNPIRWAVEKTSTIKIAGKSNVNEFTCQIPGYYQPDTILLTENENGTDVKINGCLEIDVFKFDCHNKIITKDLRKTLKTEKYPTLKVRFLSLERLPSTQTAPQYIKGNVQIELAGAKKNFTIQYEFSKDGSCTYLLNGGKVFCFSDFNLIPPRKLGGIIQVKDEFTVDFRLKLNAVK
jgi:hypothetical protein